MDVGEDQIRNALIASIYKNYLLGLVFDLVCNATKTLCFVQIDVTWYGTTKRYRHYYSKFPLTISSEG